MEKNKILEEINILEAKKNELEAKKYELEVRENDLDRQLQKKRHELCVLGFQEEMEREADLDDERVILLVGNGMSDEDGRITLSNRSDGEIRLYERGQLLFTISYWEYLQIGGDISKINCFFDGKDNYYMDYSYEEYYLDVFGLESDKIRTLEGTDREILKANMIMNIAKVIATGENKEEWTQIPPQYSYLQPVLEKTIEEEKLPGDHDNEKFHEEVLTSINDLEEELEFGQDVCKEFGIEEDDDTRKHDKHIRTGKPSQLARKKEELDRLKREAKELSENEKDQNKSENEI